MRKMLFLMLGLLLSVITVSAQTRTISGTVLSEKGEPIGFASVKLKSTNKGVVADANGTFKITAKTGDVLVVSVVGYKGAEATVSASNSISIILNSDGASTEVIVTTALGVQQRRKDLGYATAKVATSELNQAKVTNVASGLAGKVSGLNVTTVNNSVFGDLKINLRGIRSITLDNNPMLVIDGVATPLGYLSSLNPNDIEDVSILKGASGASVYGTDARNGVIIVTTKKGTRTDVPQVTFSHTTQIQKIAFLPKLQTEFGSGGYGEYIPYENWSWGDAYDGSVRNLGKPLEDGSQQTVVYSPIKNGRKNFFSTGITMQNDLSYSAKNFSLSLQDVNIKGTTPDDKNRRTGLRFSTAKEYGKFRAQFSGNYIQQNYNIFDNAQMASYNAAQNVGLNNGLLNLIFNTPAHIPLKSYKDFKNNKFATYNGYFNDYGVNPYWAIDNWRQKGKQEDFLANLELNLKATSWLNLTYRPAITSRSTQYQKTSKGEIASDYAVANRGFSDVQSNFTDYSATSNRITSELFATIDKTFSDFKLNVIVGHYFRQSQSKVNTTGVTALVVPELYNISNNGGTVTGANTISKQRLIAAFGSAKLSWKGWVNFEVGARNEWTSVLQVQPVRNNSYFFPSTSLSLVLSDGITAIKNSKTISFLKVRGSYGKTGNAGIDPYLLAPIFGQASGFPYNGLAGFTAGNSSYNPLLTPEYTTNIEYGLEIGLFKNRVNAEITVYRQKNTDQIIPVSVSSATGYTSAFYNAAGFTNKGIELDLRLTPLFKFRDGSIDFKINATRQDSKVDKVYSGLDQILIGGFTTAANWAVKGSPAFVFRANDYKRDDAGRVIVDRTTGLPTQDPNLKQYGRSAPLWQVGMTPTIRYKTISLSVVGEFKGGHYAYHQIGNAMAWTGVSAATARNHRERFVMPNSSYDDGTGKFVANTNVQIANVNDFYTGVYRDVTTNFITSADSWRIREVSLGYDIPVKVFGKQNVIKGMSVTISARNLFLWLPKSNEYTDPDFNFSTGNTSGINTEQIDPPTRIFGGSLNVRF